jgi:signal transduction histidine kinase
MPLLGPARHAGGMGGWTVRLRFTILYAVLFLACGVGLVVLTNLLGDFRASTPASAGRPDDPTGLIRALQRQVEDLQTGRSRQLLTDSLIALAVMLAVSILLGRLVASRVLRPLRAITAATRRVSAENLHQRLAVTGPRDEVKDLADTIDDLLERLEASFAAQRRFVANASHELRTPLATMRASLDVAVAKPQPSAQTVALADRIRVELDQVDSLLGSLLVLARAQHGALPDQSTVSLRDLVSRAVAARATDIAAKNLTVDEELRDTAPVQGSPTLLARMVDNLVDNAITHNQPGGWIRLATGNDRLTVETGGELLDHEKVARLSEPFQRLVADRTGAGTGLGLSIVAAIAETHGGRLELHARPDGGLSATVSLP